MQNYQGILTLLKFVQNKYLEALTVILTYAAIKVMVLKRYYKNATMFPPLFTNSIKVFFTMIYLYHS